MGNCVSVKSHNSRKIDVLITGLDGSGKSVIFFKITGHPQLNNPVSTLGINSEVILHSDQNLTIQEMGEKSTISILSGSRIEARGLVFVIDGSSK